VSEEIETCKFKVVETPEGKRLESDCLTKEAARELADLLEDHEVIIRVKPAGADAALDFNVADHPGGDQAPALECGSCHVKLNQEYASCPVCGCGLTW